MFTILAVVLAVAFMLSPVIYSLYYDWKDEKTYKAWRTEFQNRK